MQKHEDIEHQDDQMHTTNQFPLFSFCGSHNKPHGAHGLGKHYHISFDPKLGHGTYAIRHNMRGYRRV